MDKFPKIDPEKLLGQLIDRSFLFQIGEKALYIIKQRTLEGIFLPGSSPNASQYSTTPMPLPLGALSKKAQGLTARQMKEGENIKIFTNLKSRITWAILPGGYKQLRELAGKEADRVTLNWSGSMMRALDITKVDESTHTVTLGFTDNRAAELAGFHQELGAGKSKTLHKFVGLTEDEMREVAQMAQQNLDSAAAKFKFEF